MDDVVPRWKLSLPPPWPSFSYPRGTGVSGKERLERERLMRMTVAINARTSRIEVVMKRGRFPVYSSSSWLRKAKFVLRTHSPSKETNPFKTQLKEAKLN